MLSLMINENELMKKSITVNGLAKCYISYLVDSLVDLLYNK
jgi:hypothetical protein